MVLLLAVIRGLRHAVCARQDPLPLADAQLALAAAARTLIGPSWTSAKFPTWPEFSRPVPQDWGHWA